jgi:hypothetical protein
MNSKKTKILAIQEKLEMTKKIQPQKKNLSWQESLLLLE